MPAEPTAERFLSDLHALSSETERAKIARYFTGGPDRQIIGVRMKALFDLARAADRMALEEVERLLDSPIYEGRMGAVSILDFQARRRDLDDAGRRARYELYLRRHDRIDSWDMVDRAAPRVVGGYLLERPRGPLYELARSPRPLERRTAITATFWFVRHRHVADALAIAELLLGDGDQLVQRPIGTALREVGKVDQAALVAFLERHAAAMPRPTARMAAERLPEAARRRLIGGSR